MVKVGKLEIAGSLNTKNIDKGFSRIKGGFNEVKGKTKSFNADMTRIGSTVKTVGLALAGLATAGTSAMIALVKDAPQVAPAIAKIKKSMLDLKFTMGSALQPVFERTSKMVDGFVQKFKELGGPKMVSEFLMGVLDYFKKLGGYIEWVIENAQKFSNWFKGKGWKTNKELGIGEGEGEGGKTKETETTGGVGQKEDETSGVRKLGQITAAGISYLGLNKLFGGRLNKLVVKGIKEGAPLIKSLVEGATSLTGGALTKVIPKMIIPNPEVMLSNINQLLNIFGLNSGVQWGTTSQTTNL